MRTGLLTALIALLVVSSGCVGLITGETVAFEAEPASVDDAALETTGYDEARDEAQTLTRNVSVVGQERTVRITNHVAEYNRSVDLGPLGELEFARLILLSTPGATVAGQSLNPLASQSNRQLVERLIQRTERVSDVQAEGNRTVQILGEDRTVSEFTGTSDVQGQEIDIRLHVASFEHEGDVVVAVAVHPERIDERDRVDTLLGAIQHPSS
ncbi:DUF6517 family protein [Halomicroarcula sp. GCM10025324]|uniref:DUF6517 family protein n=1 Tax=Haloarcula TaxID=2237 RepID=UPI0023E842DD|nr:DUF6517 family protein [Halomicroarcula sp. ZS-22-S1]